MLGSWGPGELCLMPVVSRGSHFTLRPKPLLTRDVRKIMRSIHWPSLALLSVHLASPHGSVLTLVLPSEA